MTTSRQSFYKAGIRSVASLASLRRKRHAVASTEPEDAAMTGMTRSLDRRLLALNLRPAAAKWPALTMKVA